MNVAFTPTNTSGYTSANGSVQIIVTQATPTITWPTPAAIAAGTPLSATQLDATASFQGVSLPGTFTYTPGTGTVLSAGTHTLSVLFTPTDTTDFTTATATVKIVVGTTGSTGVTGAPAFSTGDCCFFSQPTPYTVTVAGTTAAPTGTVNVVFNSQTIGTGTLIPVSGASSSATLLLTSSYFTPGSNPVTLNYLGDTNYVPTSSSTTIALRNPAIEGNPTSVGGTGTTIDVPYAFPVAGAITFSFTPGGGAASDFTNNTGSTTCASGVQEPAGTVCIFSIAFNPGLPGIRRGAVEVDFTSSLSVAEPKLYLFLSGLGDAPQISLSNATQVTLNSSLNQPQSLTFKPTDTTNTTLYVANSNMGQLDTLPSSGGALTQWNKTNTTGLKYPSDLSFDAFGDLVVSDANAAMVVSYSPALTQSTVSTGTLTLGLPTAVRLDFAGNIYIADAGATPRIVQVPGEIADPNYTPALVNLGTQTVSFPQALGVDNTGTNLYVGDGNTNQVLQIALNGAGATPLTLAPCDPITVTSCALNSPAGFAFDPNGDMFITDSGQRVLMVPSAHSATAPTVQVPFTGLVNPTGITLDGPGNIYVTDLNGTVTKLLVSKGSVTFPTLNSSITTTVTNTGNLPLTISKIKLTTGTAYTQTASTCGSPVAAGGTCTITIKYSNAGGAKNDTLTITSNAYVTPTATIALTHN